MSRTFMFLVISTLDILLIVLDVLIFCVPFVLGGGTS